MSRASQTFNEQPEKSDPAKVRARETLKDAFLLALQSDKMKPRNNNIYKDNHVTPRDFVKSLPLQLQFSSRLFVILANFPSRQRVTEISSRAATETSKSLDHAQRPVL